MNARTVRVDPSLLDGPIMDRGGVTYARLLVKPQKAAGALKVFEMTLTDLSGVRRRERVAVALFYDGNIVVAASFTLRLSMTYQDVEGARVEVIYDFAARRARIHFATRRGTLDVTSEVCGPDVGRTPEYDEFLDAPPDEQNEVAVRPDGTLELPPAVEAGD